MPRRSVDPLIRSVEAFRTSRLENAEFALQMATQIVKARRAANPQAPKAAVAKAKRKKRTLLGSTPGTPVAAQA